VTAVVLSLIPSLEEKMKKELRESKYQWDASDYANHSTVQQKWAKELIDKLNLTGNEVVKNGSSPI